MVGNLMAKSLAKISPILKSVVDCLLSVADSLLHKLGLLWIGEALWTLDMLWVLSNVAIISFHSLSISQKANQRLTEDGNVRTLATRAGSIHPNNVSSQNAEADLIPKPRLLGKLVARKRWSHLLYLVVSAITRNQAIVLLIKGISIRPYDLMGGGNKHGRHERGVRRVYETNSV